MSLNSICVRLVVFAVLTGNDVVVAAALAGCIAWFTVSLKTWQTQNRWVLSRSYSIEQSR